MLEHIIPIISAIGAPHKIPLTPRNFGNIITTGTKQIISRSNDTIPAFTGSPTAWKNIDIIFIVQVHETNIKNILNVIIANSIYKSDSVPNILITTCGQNSNIKVDIIPIVIVNVKTILKI